MDISATMIHSFACTGMKHTYHFLRKISSFGQDFHNSLLSKKVFFLQNIEKNCTRFHEKFMSDFKVVNQTCHEIFDIKFL